MTHSDHLDCCLEWLGVRLAFLDQAWEPAACTQRLFSGLLSRAIQYKWSRGFGCSVLALANRRRVRLPAITWDIVR